MDTFKKVNNCICSLKSLGLCGWREESPETETVIGKEVPGSRDIHSESIH